MKKNISDLLDAYGDPNITFEGKTPLSSERIKELTMNKIKEKATPEKWRITFRVVLAAAIAAALALSVFGASGGAEWFRSFFEENIETALSAEQIAYIEKNAVELGQSQSVNGYTVTLDSYIGDGRTSYLKLKIQMPEGTDLPRNGCNFADLPKLYKDGEECSSYGSWWQKVELDHKTDTATYLVTLDGSAYRNSAVTAGETLVMELTDLVAEDWDETLLAKGTWRFELELFDTRQLQLLDEPMSGFQVKTWDGEPFEITLTSVTLRAMSMEATYTLPVSNMFDKPWFDEIHLVMDDGSIVVAAQTGLQGYGSSQESVEWIEFDLAVPIILDKVARIEFPGGVQIPVNIE